jgi:hypothetical protein
MREKDSPFAVDELVEVDIARGSLCLEVRRYERVSKNSRYTPRRYSYQLIPTSTVAAQQGAQVRDVAAGQQDAEPSA